MKFDVSGLSRAEMEDIMCRLMKYNISLSVERAADKVLLVSNS